MLRNPRSPLVVSSIFLVTLTVAAAAQTVDPAWLRYEGLKNTATGTPNLIAIVGRSPVLLSAGQELVRALGTRPASHGRTSALPPKDAFFLGTLKDVRPYFPDLKPAHPLGPDGFWLKSVERNGRKYWVIAGGNDRGVLYGTFALLRRLAQKPRGGLSEPPQPGSRCAASLSRHRVQHQSAESRRGS